jgi:hypothetical protein
VCPGASHLKREGIVSPEYGEVGVSHVQCRRLFAVGLRGR